VTAEVEPPMTIRRQLLDVLAGPHGTPPTPHRPADVLVVFGAADPRLAYDAAALHEGGSVRHVVFTGGVGKDSGALAGLGIAEADYLASVAIAAGLPSEVIVIERQAASGAQNAALSLRAAAANGLVPGGATVVSLAPAPRSRRLYEELRFQAAAFDPAVQVVAGIPSGKAAVDLSSAATVVELGNELRGLRTLHATTPPRIFALAEFQDGGQFAALAQLLSE
jgi:DUF218 domain